MKVALFQPMIPDRNTVPPLGLLFVAGSAREAGHDVRVYDARVDQDAVAQMLATRPDVVGMTVVTAAMPSALDAADAVRSGCPAARIVFGGPHPTALPDETVRLPQVDYVITGEGEGPFAALLEVLAREGTSADRAALSGIPGVRFTDTDGSCVSGPEGCWLSNEELDDLPRPAFDLMDTAAYFAGPQEHGLWQKGHRILPIIASRGCPYTCTFCCRVMGQRPRYHSADWVIDEVSRLQRDCGVDEIYFEDDDFFVKRDRGLEILVRLASLTPRPYFKFSNGVRIERIDREVLGAIRDAGGYTLSFGIESGCPATLRRMNKKTDLELVRRNVALSKEFGFRIGANCIIGYPGETEEDIRESVNFLVGLKVDSMAIVNLVPFPGTEVRRFCEEKGYLTPAAGDWGNYYFAINAPIPLISTPQLGVEDVKRLVRWAYRRTYLRPAFVVQAIRNVSPGRLFRGARMLLLGDR